MDSPTGLIVAIAGVIIAFCAWQYPKTGLTSPDPSVSQSEDHLDVVPERLEGNLGDKPSIITQGRDEGTDDHKRMFSNLVSHLRKLSMDDRKLDFIKNNTNCLPRHLSLQELNELLGLHTSDCTKAALTKRLAFRVRKDYPDSEFDKFTNQFATDSYQNEAVSFLLNELNRPSLFDQ